VYLNQTYSKVRVSTDLSAAFLIQDGLKQVDYLSILLLKFSLEFHIRKEMNEILLVCADGVNILGGNINAEKTRYIFMIRNQNAERNHSLMTGNKSLENMEKFKYLGTKELNENYTREETKSRLNLGNACYRSVQNLLPPSLVSKILKITKLNCHFHIILLVVLCGVELVV